MEAKNIGLACKDGAPPKKYLPIKAAADWLSVSPATVKLALSKRHLRRFKAGRGAKSRTLIAIADLEKFVREV